MENASKALLIAGSVLVVILLIAIGVRVLNSTQGTTEATESTMKNTEIAMFNNQFVPYAGKKVTAAEAYTLVNKIFVNNAQNKDHYITIQVNGKTTNSVHFDNSKTYSVGMSFDSNGYIYSVRFKVQG